jgi:hypothetical protein
MSDFLPSRASKPICVDRFNSSDFVRAPSWERLSFFDSRLPVKCLLLFQILSLIVWCGCGSSPKGQRTDGSGYFDNGKSTVLWRSLCDSTTNDIRFVLLCPETTEVGTSNQSDGNACYDRFDLRTKYDGHRWTIEAKANSTAGTESLWLSDQTANLVTNLNLGRSRFWRLSDEGIWIPLEKIDFATNRRVLGDSEAGFKRTVSLRKGM